MSTHPFARHSWIRHCHRHRHRHRHTLLLVTLLQCLTRPASFSADLTLRVSATPDPTSTPPRVRPLHGINKGPLTQGGLINLTPQLKSFQIPSIRLHDCQWPYPDVVDMHAIFRHPDADPSEPQSYDFALTDEYLDAVAATGASIVYRLGESIEHGRVKRFVHPPADFRRWADACVGIIRHYNEGWAHGFHHGIQYWEIWNEPENRPAMWSGSDVDYFKLYQVTSQTIRKHNPNLKIGGPAVGDVGHVLKGQFQPSAFTRAFLHYVREHQLPLDFFSWHTYTDTPGELVDKARGVRALLDSLGLSKTESHLNEWNYLPDRSWEGISSKATPSAREAYYKRMSGAEGAAFVTRTLIDLQKAPVDMCNLFHGEVGPFGLFSEQGEPQPNASAWAAFARFNLATPLPLQAQPSPQTPNSWSALAARTQTPDENSIRILLALTANPKTNDPRLSVSVQIQIEGIPSTEHLSWTVERLDAEHRWSSMKGMQKTSQTPLSATTILTLTPPTVALIELRHRP